MVQLQQLLVQHHAPLQLVLDHDPNVLQQLGTLLQKTPLAENKMLENLEVLSSLTNLFKTPNSNQLQNPPQPSHVHESANPPHAQVTVAPALDGLDKIARTHVADNQPYLEASKPQSSYTGPNISDIRQDRATQEKVSLVVDALKNISPVFGQPSSGIPTLPGISPLDQLKQHLAGNTGTFLPGVPNTPSPSQPQPLNILEQLRSLLLPGTPPQPPQVLLQPVPPQPQDLLQQLKELLIPNTTPQPTPQPVVQQLQDPLHELRNILLQQLPTAPPPLYAQHPVYVPQQPTLLPHQVPVPHQSPQTSQLAQLLSSLQGVSTTATNSLQQMSATQPQPRMLPQAQSLPQPHQMTLQQLLQHPEILQQLTCSLNQPSTTQHGLLEAPKQQQSQPKQQQPQHSQPTGLQGMSQVRPVYVRPT